MIRLTAVGYVLGQFLLVFGALMLIPGCCAVFTGTPLGPIAYSFAITLAAGGLLWRSCARPTTELSQREGILLASSVWVAISLFGSLPFCFSPAFPSVTDAVFEATSGFSTTGATILADVEVLPMDLQLWRHLTHWLGGMGIVLLGVAILPLIGLGGMHLYRAEFSGAKSDKLKPRITETALALWKIYFALTFAEYVLLRLAGMGTFDAVCHSFSTMGTGGFSTRTASVAAFKSPLIEYIIIVFMLLAGINFARHYQLWVEHRPSSFFGDIEIRWFVGIIGTGAAAIFGTLFFQQNQPFEPALRAALFQATSIGTCTGFATKDFEQWLPLAQLILLALMFTGGCTGSTSGGLKISRMVLLLRVVLRDFHRMVERRAVFAIRLGDQVIPETAIQSVLNMVYLAFLVNFTACLLLAAVGVDVLTCISAVASCMFNVGPGLGQVGPADNYGVLPAAAKWVLCAVMIAGRLEFFTALAILSPGFWRK